MNDNKHQINILTQQRDSLGEKDIKQSHELKLQIFALLKKEFHTGTDKTFPHHSIQHEQRKASAALRSELISNRILQGLATLRNDKRQQEVTDTSLVGYLQLLFTPDSFDYKRRTRDDKISGTEEYLQQQSNIIESMDFDLSRLDNYEFKNIFSLCTDHTYDGKIPMIRYRHQAIQYIAQLKEVLSTAIPYKLNKNELSYKIITLTKGPGAGKIIEFSYDPMLDEAGHEDKGVRTTIHSSIIDYKQHLYSVITKISQKITSLQHISNIFNLWYNQNKSNNEKTDRAMKTDELRNSLTPYHDIYVEKINRRIENTEIKDKWMHAPQYMMTMGAMLRNLEDAILDQAAKHDRLKKYLQG